MIPAYIQLIFKEKTSLTARITDKHKVSEGAPKAVHFCLNGKKKISSITRNRGTTDGYSQTSPNTTNQLQLIT